MGIFNRKGKLVGKGVIKIRTYLLGDRYITFCKHKFGELSIDGVISELEKIIKELKVESNSYDKK